MPGRHETLAAPLVGFPDKSALQCERAQTSESVTHDQGPCLAESPQKGTKTKKVDYDFTGEQLHFESAPHRGDLATNIALGATLLWLPLTFAAVGRAAFLKYRFTDKRISVITDAPWKSKPQQCSLTIARPKSFPSAKLLAFLKEREKTAISSSRH